jgi:hypothetical protein
MRTLLLSALLTLAAAAQSANYSGKWLIEQPGRGGRVQRSILTLNHVGSEVEGMFGARFSDSDGSPVHREILAGKVENGVLSFYVWSGSDKPAKAFYRGTLSGETIEFTIIGGAASPGAAPPQPRKVVAKRTK